MPVSEQATRIAAGATAKDRAPESRLTVLFITRKWPPAVGGMETYCIELVRELRQRVQLKVIALPGRDSGAPPSILALAAFFLRAFWYLARRGSNYDILHLSDLALAPLARFNRFANPRCRNVISAHGTDISFAFRRGWRAVLYRNFLHRMAKHGKSVDAVLANSSATGRLCQRANLGEVSVVKLATRHAGCAPSIVTPPPDPYVLFVGRLVRRKGAGWFIREVLPLLPEEIELRIAGTLWDPEEEAALASERVTYLGPVFGPELAELRRRAIAVVMPNTPANKDDFEGFGLAALEATADGGVLLASEIDGIVDAVIDGLTGFLLPPEDPETWARQLLEIRDWSESQRNTFLAKALHRLDEDYAWPRVAEETIETYRGRKTIHEASLAFHSGSSP